MYVIYRFVYIYKFIFYRFTIYLYKITYIFVKFGNFWVVILRKRQFLGFNSSNSREFFFFLPPVWRHSIFLECLWCREYGGIRSLRVNKRDFLTKLFLVSALLFYSLGRKNGRRKKGAIILQSVVRLRVEQKLHYPIVVLVNFFINWKFKVEKVKLIINEMLIINVVDKRIWNGWKCENY